MLRVDRILSALHPSNCTCSRKCTLGIKTCDVLKYRAEEVLHCLPADEAGCTAFLAASMRRTLAENKGGQAYRWAGKLVCREFFAAVAGVSVNKVRAARRMAESAPGNPFSFLLSFILYVIFFHTGISPAQVRKPNKKTRTNKFYVAFAFWKEFFDTHCQRPNDDIRLFPVNKPYNIIWEEYFLPWFEKLHRPDSDKPAFTFWEKVRWQPEFADVKRRVRHYHCRCPTCASLSAKLLGSIAGDHMQFAAYQRERRLHDASVRAWRKLEMYHIIKAQSCPHEQMTFLYDDTEALGLPRFTLRSIKTLSTSRFNVVPWFLRSVSEQRNDYVYMSKGRWKKGGNRLITQLYAAIKRAKDNANGKSFRARKLVLIADNATENKNNQVLAFFVDMVSRGWLDEVELLFGEPGHTHNGGDAVHKIHNVGVGNATSGDLGHFVSQYKLGWQADSDRPAASILDVVYD